MTAVEPARTVQSVAVIGAGTMGRGIAQIALFAGLRVGLADEQPEQLEVARERVAIWLQRSGVEDAPELATGSVEEICMGADLVIEAVLEDVEVKSQVLSAAERASGDYTVLATNTSGLSINALARALHDPSRFLGMHFFNPADRMPLCEIVPGELTSADTVGIGRAVASRFGKTPIVVADSPGFVASRLNCLLGNEALVMLEDGIADAEAIDAATRLGLNHPMGPLELLDLVGLDVRLAALHTLERAYGERFRPTRLHEQLVADGRLGVKSGVGIYTYDHNQKKRPEMKKAVEGETRPRRSGPGVSG
jgi:3-hydroxybutyryl-CoA dehydrogenase